MLQFLDVIRIRARRLLQCLGAALSVGPVRLSVRPVGRWQEYFTFMRYRAYISCCNSESG